MKRPVHDANQHKTATFTEIYDETTFLKYARDFNKFNSDCQVQIFKPRSNDYQKTTQNVRRGRPLGSTASMFK